MFDDDRFQYAAAGFAACIFLGFLLVIAHGVGLESGKRVCEIHDAR